jgi:hypothetical protein
MKKIKVSEATPLQLNWMVAKAIGLVDANRVVVDFKYMSGEDPVRWEPELSTYYSSAYSPTTDWAMGGPIVEREKIGVWWATHVVDDEGNEYGNHWYAEPGMTDENADKPYTCMTGPTPLIAAMRCYVASKLGDEVEIPEELE